MFFADNYGLTRSSVFRTLLSLVLVITLVNIVFIGQVFVDSEDFHRQQLEEQLNDELMEFRYAASMSPYDVQQLLRTKQAANTPFTYLLTELPEVATSQTYPALNRPRQWNRLTVTSTQELEIQISDEMLQAYRKSIFPIVFSGVIFPSMVLLMVTLLFTIAVLRKLERVNQAMNRVLCGERDVKLPVSTQDDEFDILAIHLNYMIEEMNKNEKSLQSLTTGLAHDMRTPMARLKLRLEDVLSKPNLDPESEKQFNACYEELELLLSLFNSMLEIAKLNSGHQLIGADQIELGLIARDAIEFLHPIAEQKQQSLTLRIDQECILNGDKSLMFRAIFNLVENAVKYTPKHGSIEVICDQYGIVVADSGIGISQQDKLHVTKPMYRADKSRTEYGNGLGLSLVAAVVKRHNAELVLKDNNPGLRARILLSP